MKKLNVEQIDKLLIMKAELEEMANNEYNKGKGNEFLIECLEDAYKNIRYAIMELKEATIQGRPREE